MDVRSHGPGNMPLDSSLFWDCDTGCLKAALYIPGYNMDTPKNIIKKNNTKQDSIRSST